jgi:hypothetical protein
MSALSIRLRAGVPSPPFGSPSIFVYEVRQLRDIFNLISCQLLQYLDVPHPLVEGHDDRCWGDLGNGVTDL